MYSCNNICICMYIYICQTSSFTHLSRRLGILKTLLKLPCKLAMAPGKPPSGPYSSKKLRALKCFGKVVSTLGSSSLSMCM